MVPAPRAAFCAPLLQLRNRCMGKFLDDVRKENNTQSTSGIPKTSFCKLDEKGLEELIHAVLATYFF